MVFVCEVSKESKESVSLKIACIGAWFGHSAGELIITQENLEEIKTNFDSRKIDCVIDYEHQSLEGGKNPAAGWIKSLQIKGDGLFAEISWTEEAKDLIKKDAYRYLSPTFITHHKDFSSGADTGMFLHSVALTNTPFLDCIDEARANSINPKNKGDKMDLKEQLEALEKENKALKEQIAEQNEKIACSAVENAMIACKLNANQKEWALSYAKNDLSGFEKFLSTVEVKKQEQDPVLESNIFANSTRKKDNNDAIDVVKMALEY